MFVLVFCQIFAQECVVTQRLDIIDSKQVRWEEKHCSGGPKICETHEYPSLAQCEEKLDNLLMRSPGKGAGNYVIVNCQEKYQ